MKFRQNRIANNLRSGVIFFCLLLCFFVSRERHKGIIGRGHDLRLDSERFLHPRLFRLSIFFSPVRGAGEGCVCVWEGGGGGFDG